MAKLPVKKVGELINTYDHPMYISYFGEALVLSPRMKVQNIEKEKLGTLPKGVVFIEYK